ncbi:MAG: hypothetical protein ACRDQZ_16640 [Mycobacteriales bacterium]
MRSFFSSLALVLVLCGASFGQFINLGPGSQVKGTLQPANCPALTGDTTAAANACITTTSSIHGTTVPINAAANQLIVTTSSGVGAWSTLPNCDNDGAHALVYDNTTQLFGCASITGSGGGNSIKVNGSSITGTNGNFDDSTPSSSANFVNVQWQLDTSTPDTNISAQVPAATDTILGVVKSKTCSASQWFSAIATGTGAVTCSQPAFSDLSGSLDCSQTPALTGDTTTSAGSCATTTAKLNGASIPASAAVAGTNSSSQVIAATGHHMTLPLACADVSGSGTAQSCGTSPSYTPASGDWILYSTTMTNTGDVTVNVNSLGAKHVRKWLAAAVLASGDLLANTPTLLVYDGTYWEVSTIGNAPSFSQLSGSATCGQLPALTGDTTSSAGTCGTTTAKINGTSFAGVNGHVVSFGAVNIPADSGVVAADVITYHTPATGIARTTSSSQAVAGSELSGDVTTSGSNVTTLGSSYKIRGLPFTIYNPGGLASGSTIASTDYLTVPFACTIAAYNLVVDAGTITVKFWKVATGTAIQTSGNSISTSGVGISSGTAIHSATTSDFTTTSVSANDIMAMNITAVATATYVQGVLQCNQP